MTPATSPAPARQGTTSVRSRRAIGRFLRALGRALGRGWRWPGLLVTAWVLAACGGGSGGTGGAPNVTPAAPRWQLQTLPAGLGEGTRLHPAQAPAADGWCLYRSWPDEHLHVVADCGSDQPRVVSYPRAAQGELLALQAFEADGSLLLAVYDAARNIPSGRIPGTTSDGVDVVRFSRDGALSTLAERLPLGGFDNLLHGGSTADGFTLCGASRCFVLATGAPAREWDTAGLAGHEIVEAVVSPWGVDALVRTIDDGYSGRPPDGFGFAWARIDDNGARVLQTVPSDCVPHKLQADAVRATWQCARTPAELADLLRGEIARMPHGGLIDLGASNVEARIVWSQVYYLSGLMQLGGGSLPHLAAAADWSLLRDRLRAEVDLLARRADALLDGYRVRRYAMQRTPLLFALHLGRVAQVLDVARTTGHDSATVAQAMARVGDRLATLDGTVEQAYRQQVPQGTFDALRFTPGIDFWADGANVPFNYTSAYVHGLLLARGPDQAERAQALLAPLLTLEPVASATGWHYWWGRGVSGWTAAEGVSVNTPNYAGSNGPAHISYRSIDAMSLLTLERLQPGALPAGLQQHLRTLVAQGSLLPSVNEAASRLPGGAVALQARTAYRWSRAAAPWELQSQVWALETLAAATR
ncbi:MAG TPA: hypothetical protein PK306_03440 [Aquabacterium sp.]|nr:hypothetical protein [Aquabacterium sp.]HQC94745.1 hypothetical protein [Aquabacterium sp.]